MSDDADEEVDVEFENADEFEIAKEETDFDVDIEAEPFRSNDRTPESTPEDDPLEAFDTPDDDPLGDDVFDEMDTDSEFDDADVFDLIEDEPEADADNDLLELQEVEAVDDGAIVPKSQYCEQCEHFSAPPEMACEHAGTTIHELTDLDHVRVTECPVVTERTRMQSRDDE